jgi:hypothetical protein
MLLFDYSIFSIFFATTTAGFRNFKDILSVKSKLLSNPIVSSCTLYAPPCTIPTPRKLLRLSCKWLEAITLPFVVQAVESPHGGWLIPREQDWTRLNFRLHLAHNLYYCTIKPQGTSFFSASFGSSYLKNKQHRLLNTPTLAHNWIHESILPPVFFSAIQRQ